MKLFLSYLKQKLADILLFSMLGVIMSCVLMLYGIPATETLYPFLICFFAGAIRLIFGFSAFRTKHAILHGMSDSVMTSIQALPQPSGVIEDDYQELICRLRAENSELTAEYQGKITDMTDYYTLWAHQIKTPISAMRLLLQTGEAPQDSELASELFKIEQYVEMVLQYLRLDSSSSDLIIRRYSLDSIARQAVKKYAPIFIRSKISLTYEVCDIKVITDEKWLVFVIEQILSNSLKYTQDGSITVKSDGARLIISDTGTGIRPEDLPRIFEKGYTGFNGRIDKKSTGIGLYLCKRILSKLNHSIAIESVPGKSTTVTIGLEAAETVIE